MDGRPYISPDRESLLADLNSGQREAVTHTGGPLLVVAGAGTGKTRVLTRRVAWLVAGGLPARSVLAITFTNKAADVLRERLAALPGGREVWAGTFHSFAAFTLRRHGDAIGVSPDYTVLDREDQRRLLRDLIADLGTAGAGLKPADVSSMISHVKNGAGGKAPLDLSSPDEEAAFERLCAQYGKRLRAANLLDFDDLLLQGLRLLADDEATARHYQDRFAHVLVDEYQDTNLVQADLLKALLGPGRGLTVVGDPDQSIYRWRGAAVRNILEFEEDFPGSHKVVLERNYRSTRRILEAAEEVIARNHERHAKRLFSEREEGTPLVEVRCRDAEDEAAAIADLLQGWQAEGFPWDGMAVFYRVNALSRAVELALRSRSVPYVIVAGVEFFQRREVKDLLAYARLVENPRDDAAFLRVVNVPRRGVGKTTVEKVRTAAILEGVSCPEAAPHVLPRLAARTRKGLQSFLSVVEEARSRPRAPVGPLLDFLAESSGYRAHLASQVDDLGLSRVENVDELIAYAHEFDRRDGEGGLTRFLEQAALVTDQDAWEYESGRVSLMSVHAAKGLEFPCVVVAGAEMDYFPHARNADDPRATEEERRLFYVALTRAQERLACTHTMRRLGWRGEEMRLPSPFLRDVPDVLIERRDRVRAAYQTPAPLFERPETGPDRGGADVVRDAGPGLVLGERVRHPYFGEGTLASQQGAGAEARVTVDFALHGRKQLLLSHARLERLS